METLKAFSDLNKIHTFELKPLPYAYNELDPILSEQTLKNHHGSHHL